MSIGNRDRVRDRAPTSIDVARHAGVSQATVSRFLNGHPVSDEVQAALTKAIADLGYRPNHAARSLVTNQTKVIAVVLGDLLNGYYGELYTTIHAALTQHGFRPLMMEGRVSIPGQLLSEVQADGVIVATSLMRPEQERIIIDQQLPTVMLNRTSFRSIDNVGTENHLGGMLAARHLVSLGHRRLGMIVGPAGADAIVARSAGFIEELAKSGIGLNEEDIDPVGFDYRLAYEASIRMLSRRKRPSAIFCHNDQIAIAALNAATALGISVPEELSVVGFDDVSMASWERIALTTIKQPIQEIAACAVDLLIARLNDRQRPIQSFTLPCRLIERRSTGPAKT